MGAVAFCKRVMRPQAHGHLFCSPSQFGQWYRVWSNAREEEESDSNAGESIASKENERKKKTVFGFGRVPLHYTREVEIVVTSICSHKAHYVDASEQPAQLEENGFSYGNVLCHVSYGIKEDRVRSLQDIHGG